MSARVKDRKRDHDGKRIGATNLSHMINTVIYNVETSDDNIRKYTANVIAENLWNQVDDDAYKFHIIYETIRHRKNDNVISKDDGFYETKTGVKRKLITTKVWDVQVRWETGETSYISLKDIKKNNIIKITEDVISNKLN